MTKKEIMEAWADMPEDADVLLDTWEAYEPVTDIEFVEGLIILR